MIQQPGPEGELLTRWTVWLALTGYATGLVVFYLSGAKKRADQAARIFWTAGCIALLAHIAFAFHFYHQWSHASAYQETAALTSEIYGVYWGGGVFVNYILIIAWVADVIWWWTGLDNYRNRPKFISIAWHVFLFFIFFNATVVFEEGALRVIGIVFALAIGILFLTKFVHGRQVKI